MSLAKVLLSLTLSLAYTQNTVYNFQFTRTTQSNTSFTTEEKETFYRKLRDDNLIDWLENIRPLERVVLDKRRATIEEMRALAKEIVYQNITPEFLANFKRVDQLDDFNDAYFRNCRLARRYNDCFLTLQESRERVGLYDFLILINKERASLGATGMAECELTCRFTEVSMFQVLYKDGDAIFMRRNEKNLETWKREGKNESITWALSTNGEMVDVGSTGKKVLEFLNNQDIVLER